MAPPVHPSGDDGLPLERAVLDDLFSAAYEELRRLASAVRRNDHSSTRSATTLVNEAWVKLAASPMVLNHADRASTLKPNDQRGSPGAGLL